ncbi:MAG: hypothetical protein L0H63_05550 [Nitrococcus sp.]|nr:hypothetical protein [Nitrococcus sp.]
MHKLNAFVLLAFCVLSALAGDVRAETTVRVLETYPAGDVITLGEHQTFYLRIGYSTDEPVRIWARPYFQGNEVDAGSNPSRVYAGSGEALGWLFFMEPGKQVDEVRISAGERSPSGPRAVATYSVRITGSSQPAVASTEPAWLVELRNEDKRLQQEAYEQRMSTPPTAGETLLVRVLLLAVLALGVAGIAVPVWAWWRWSGGWRVAAAVPAAMMGFVVLRIVLDTAADPTSHNLWPFEILQVGCLSLVVMGVLGAARKFSGAQA